MAKRRTTIIIEEEIGLENTKSVFVNEENAKEVKTTKTKKSTSKNESKTTKTKSSTSKSKTNTSKSKSTSKKDTKKKTSSKKSSKKSSRTKEKEVKEIVSPKDIETKDHLESTQSSIIELPSPNQKENTKDLKNEIVIKEEDKLTPSLLNNDNKETKETITNPEIIDPIKEVINNKEDKDNKNKEDIDIIDATIIEKDNSDKNTSKENKEDSSKSNLEKDKEDKSKNDEEKNLPAQKEENKDKSKEKEDKDTALPDIKKEDKDNKEENDTSSKDKKEDKAKELDTNSETQNIAIVPETPIPLNETQNQDTSSLKTQKETQEDSQQDTKENKEDSKKLPLSVKLNPLSLIKLFSKSKYKGVIIGTTILVILVAILVPISINLLNKDPYKEINEEDINKDNFIKKDEFFNEVASFDLKLATSKYNDTSSDGYLVSSFNKVNGEYAFLYETRFDDSPETSMKENPLEYKTEIKLDEETSKYILNNYEDGVLINNSSLEEKEAISYIKEYVNSFYDSYLIYDSLYLKGIIDEGKENNFLPKYFINEETGEIKVSSSPSDTYEFNYDQNGILKDGIYASSIKESKDNPESTTSKIYSELEFKYTLNS